ncbi:hypothetical protein [Aeromicrobium sp.]|uniref:hypothetical protein n=1 Tax=Aeromicrobium sp. TaxID=1871063 RepID=UPI0019A43825|nr:hypothetical protein [Aeromicrobium sp.]MBC7629979.1 hypothetical protein [Aeromicrobium sp.]
MALAAALLVWQRPWQGSDDSAVAIPADAASVLTDQFRALSTATTESDFAAAAGGTAGARTFARRAWASRTALGASGVDLRYVSGGEVTDREDGSSEATIEVTWQPDEESGLAMVSNHTSSVAFRVAPQRGGGFSIVSVRPVGGALPLWLAGKVIVERRPGANVIRVDGGDTSLPVESMAAVARSAVARVVPGTRGNITVVSPHTQQQMAQLVGQDVAEVAQIAAVTTRLDGRGADESSADVVVLNPTVFATMDRRAAQVVMSHEATHLLTDAVGSSAASWVIEGFADFVALHDDTAPLSLSAGQVLAEVKAGRSPTRLPTSGDFDATRHGLGAVYESAWMAFRLLGARDGDKAVVSFYESVLRGADLDKALKSSFGTSQRRLTTDWRAYLTKSASIVS